jgi:hypothetical protein
MQIVNQQLAGSGNGSGYYAVNSSWTLNLAFTPTPGNTLLLFMGLVNGTSIAASSFSGAGMTNVFANGVSNAGIVCLSATVPSSPGNSISLIFGSGGFQFATILQEVTSITSLYEDQSSHATGTSGTYATGSTSTTSQNLEYWANAYAYYNSSTGNDPTGVSPSNGYSLVYSGQPVKPFQSGWVWSSGTMSVVSPLTSSGLLMTSQFAMSEGTAGGTVSDLSVHNNLFFGAAITFLGPSVNPVVFSQMQGIKRRPPLRSFRSIR